MKKSIIFSAITLCLCTLVVVGGTYALFTDTVSVNYHLSAGNLKVGLDRTAFTKYVVDEKTGLMTTVVDTGEPVDLTQDANKLFVIDKAVPTSWYEAELTVTNDGTTAFDYGMRIIWNNDNDVVGKDLLLAEQIMITVTSEKIADSAATGKNSEGVNYISFKLSESKGKDISFGYFLKDSSAQTFTVKAEFINNTAENNKINVGAGEEKPAVTFDVQVFATQKTELSESETE